MAEAAIEIRDLVKEYAAQGDAPSKLALKGISLEVPEGGIFGCWARTVRQALITSCRPRPQTQAHRHMGHDIDRDPERQTQHRLVPRSLSSRFPRARCGRTSGRYGWPGAAPSETLRAVHWPTSATPSPLHVGRDEATPADDKAWFLPPILVLDEPTDRVDWASAAVGGMVRSSTAKASRVTPQYLAERELCDRLRSQPRE